MKLAALIAILTTTTIFSLAQTSTPDVKSGSYLYYGQPYLEDNSMLIDEAFNQETGIIQHISNVIVTASALQCSYTQEIPLVSHQHQLSFGISYGWLKNGINVAQAGSYSHVASGFGDILLSYRPMIAGKHDWALVIPRFTVIVPTGNAQSGLGNGGWGSQLSIAVTKRLSSKITTHTNAGYTYIVRADHYRYESNGMPASAYERDLASVNLGASLVWLAKQKMHLLAEYVFSYGKTAKDNGSFSGNCLMTVNPGVRYAFDIGKVQIVPGVGVPLNFNNGVFDNAGTFIYLSVEPCYAQK
jgi:hypothetical protein